MSDLISRQATLDTVQTMYERCDTGDITDYRDLMYESIIVLPSVQEQQWIPETERLPEEGGRYVVTRISAEDGVRRIDIRWYSTFSGWEWDERPVAWMPLPEPYKGEK